MVRRSGTSRVTSSKSGAENPESDGPQPREFPSLRQRRPVMYWVVVIAVVAMVLTTVGSFIGALA